CFSFPGSAARAPDRGLRTRPYLLAAPAIAREESRSPQPLERRSAWRGQNSTTIRRAVLSGGFPCPIANLWRAAYTMAVTPTPEAYGRDNPWLLGRCSEELVRLRVWTGTSKPPASFTAGPPTQKIPVTTTNFSPGRNSIA